MWGARTDYSQINFLVMKTFKEHKKNNEFSISSSHSFKVFLTYADGGNVIFSIFDHELLVRNIASIYDFTNGLNKLLKQNCN